MRNSLAKIRTELANERTFLAYIRTALSLTVTGLAFIKLFDNGEYFLLGIIVIVLGLSTFSIGLYRFMRYMIIVEKKSVENLE